MSEFCCSAESLNPGVGFDAAELDKEQRTADPRPNGFNEDQTDMTWSWTIFTSFWAEGAHQIPTFFLVSYGWERQLIEYPLQPYSQ